MIVEQYNHNLTYEVLIKDPTYVNTIKKTWKTISPEQFHVVADFDRTLTKAHVDGHRSSTVLAQIRNGNYLSDAYNAEAHRLFDTYHPIEIDESIPKSERMHAMQEWWEKHFTLIGQSGLTRDMITRIAQERPMHFREGTKELFASLKTHGVPMVLLSAAPGDMVKAYLDETGLMDQTIHLLATMYKFDTDGTVLGVQEPIIHSMNKQETTIDWHKENNVLTGRTHVLLLGDGIGDVDMIQGFAYESLLKVGFLNENIEQNKTAFMNAYDMVITHDGPMTPVHQLLAESIFRDN